MRDFDRIANALGSYRLILALLVLASHAQVYPGGHNMGVAAVVSFLILSGYVMTALIEKSYLDLRRIGYFYADRALRLLPQFLLYLLLTVAFIGLNPGTQDADATVSAPNVALNALVIPLGLYMFVLRDGLFMPPTWSLGLEAMFYVAIPFVLILRGRTLVFWISVAIFAAAQVGAVNADIWGYRLLPGTMFVFMIGSFLRTMESRRSTRLTIATAACAGVALIVSVANDGSMLQKDMLAGLLIGIPAVSWLVAHRQSRLDSALGDLSYGVFLNHWLLILVARHFGYVTNEPVTLCALIVVSVIASAVSFRYVERPLVALRHRFRRSAQTASTTTATA